MAAGTSNEAFIQEFLFDSDSNDDFEGFTQVDIDAEVVGDREDSHTCDMEENCDDPKALSGYYHPWLTNFLEATGPMNLPNSYSEGELFCLFINDEIITLFLKVTNKYTHQMKGR